MSEALEKSRMKWMQFGLLVVLSFCCAFLLVDVQGIPQVDLKVGEEAQRDLVTPIDLRFVDTDATAKALKSAAQAVPEVYAYDLRIEGAIGDGLNEAFEASRSAAEAARGLADGEPISEENEAALGQGFLQNAGMLLEGEPLQALTRTGFSEAIQSRSARLLGKVMWRFVIADASFLPENRSIVVASIDGDQRAEEQLDDRRAVWSVPQTHRELRDLGVAMQKENMALGDEIDLAVAVAIAAVRPNFSKDQAASAQRREAATRVVAEVERKIAKGSLLLRAGEQITSYHVQLSEVLKDRAQAGVWWKAFVSTFLLCLLFVGGVSRFCMIYMKKFSSKRRDLTALSVLILLGLGLTRFVMEVCEAASTQGSLPVESIWFVVPVAGCALLVRVLLNSETALAYALVVGTLCGITMDQNVFYTGYFVLTSIVASGVLGLDSDRKAVLKAGLIAGLVGGLYILLVPWVQQSPSGSTLVFGEQGLPWMAVIFSVVGGLLSAFLVLALLPLFELAGFVTDLQLLELSNLSHPLLSNLLMRAPGSYHHSVMVGTLAEAGAKEVGCNPLLCRVAAYFHDIGKAVSPQYFVENQRSGENPHDRLSPEMSARVIIDHVRNGGEIAKRHKLPQPIVDNIYMHHGTGLLYFFYQQAKAVDPNVDPAQFRYPGPKPNTREAGIVQLADKVEAACRSIKEPTPDRIRKMIQRIISSTLSDGQLEDCPLTLQDLYKIAAKFEEVILAIHHQRIEYPETADVSSGTDSGGQSVTEVKRAGNDDVGVITLDLPPREADEIRAGAIPFRMETGGDYESAEALPEGSFGRSGTSRRPPKKS
jgi:putative nucleotidyltransferase with HDIG domain